jgi:hypothetical protein
MSEDHTGGKLIILYMLENVSGSYGRVVFIIIIFLHIFKQGRGILILKSQLLENRGGESIDHRINLVWPKHSENA